MFAPSLFQRIINLKPKVDQSKSTKVSKKKTSKNSKREEEKSVKNKKRKVREEVQIDKDYFVSE